MANFKSPQDVPNAYSHKNLRKTILFYTVFAADVIRTNLFIIISLHLGAIVLISWTFEVEEQRGL